MCTNSEVVEKSLIYNFCSVDTSKNVNEETVNSSEWSDMGDFIVHVNRINVEGLQFVMCIFKL
jgi:hypothetical protein